MNAADWSGWLWLGGRWWRACQAGTLTECSTKLTRAADEEGVPDTDCLLTRGSAPVGLPLGRLIRSKP